MNKYSHKITYFHAPIPVVLVEPHAKIDQWNGALGVWLGASQDLIHTGICNQVCHQRVLAIVRNCDPNEHSCDEVDALHLGDLLSAWREAIIKSRFKANFVVIGCCNQRLFLESLHYLLPPISKDSNKVRGGISRQGKKCDL